jgi:hypothetical protein
MMDILITAVQGDRLLDMAKNKAAVALGKRRAALAAPGEMSKLGKEFGASGGHARANKLTAKRRKEIAQKAAKARWGKKGK